MLNGYEWESKGEIRFDARYEFGDDNGNRFLVVIKNDKVGPSDSPKLGNSWEITYFAWDSDIGDWSISKMVRTNVHRIMSTIFGSILKSFLCEFPFTSLFRIEGIPRESEDKDGRCARTKLYLRHLESNPIDGYEVESDGRNRIFLIKRKR